MSDIANLTPEEPYKAGLPVVAQLEAWIVQEEAWGFDGAGATDLLEAYHEGRAAAFKDALALVTAKDADRDLDQ